MLPSARSSTRTEHWKQPQRFRPIRHLNKTTFSLLAIVGLLLQAVISIEASQHQVFIYSNSSTILGQIITSSTLVWESYDAKDARQLQFAVEGGKYLTEDAHYPICVCRVNIDGLYSNGHTEKMQQAILCVAKQKKYEQFDVLVNKGHLGKVVWKHWNTYNAGTPIGAIRFGNENDFIARHQATVVAGADGDSKYVGADYNLGRFDPVGFGKIKVVEPNWEEKYYDDGDVLVETQPFRYELRDIKLDKIRLDIRENITILASSVLGNYGNEYDVVEVGLSYDFDYSQNWGSHEGTVRGLPAKIYEKDSPAPADVNWGIKHTVQRSEIKTVHTKLYPGTAINVTLKGTYVTLNAPYSAKLFAFYYGIEESVSRKIQSEVTKSYLKDVKLEYSPTYFIENGTIIQTTSTTSTSSSTTSTTTHATTTAGQPKPIHEPPVVQIQNTGDQHSGPDTLEKSLHDSPAINEIPQDIPENYSEQHQKHALAGIATGNDGSTFQRKQWSVGMSLVVFSIAFVLNI